MEHTTTLFRKRNSALALLLSTTRVTTPHIAHKSKSRMSITPYSQKKTRAKDGDEEGDGQIRREIGILDIPDEIFFAIFDSLPPSCPWLFAIATVCRRFAAVMKAYNLGPVNTPPRFYLSHPKILSLAIESGLDLETMNPIVIGRTVRGMRVGRAEMVKALHDRGFTLPPYEMAKFNDDDWRRFCELGYDWIFRDIWNLQQEEYYKDDDEKTVPDKPPVCGCHNHYFGDFSGMFTPWQKVISLRLKGYRWPAKRWFYPFPKYQTLKYALETGASPTQELYSLPAFIATKTAIDEALRLGLPKTELASRWAAVKFADIDVLEYMHALGYPMAAELCQFFITGDDNEKIKDRIERLLKMGVGKDNMVYMPCIQRERMLENGIELAAWLSTMGFPIPSNLALCAVQLNCIEGVKFALKHGCEKNPSLTLAALKHATVEMLQFLLRNGVPQAAELSKKCCLSDTSGFLNEARLHGAEWVKTEFFGGSVPSTMVVDSYLEAYKDKPVPITPEADLQKTYKLNREGEWEAKTAYYSGPSNSMCYTATTTAVRQEDEIGGLPGRVVPDPPEWDEDYVDDKEWARDRLFKHLTRWFPADDVNEYIDREFPLIADDVYANKDNYTNEKRYAEYCLLGEPLFRHKPLYLSVAAEYRNGRQRNMEQRRRRGLGGAVE